MPNARYCFLIPLAATVVSLGGLAALGTAGWPGDVGGAGTNFCEATRPGVIKQPANTFSNVGFYLVGLAIGWQAWRDVAARKAANWSNRLVTTVSYPVGIATCSVLIGAGSTALHASMTPWGGELDLLAMHLWGAWMIAFASVRLFRRGDREFAGLYASLVGGLLTRLLMGQPYAITGSSLFGLMVGTSIVIELVGRWRNRHRIKMDNQYLVTSVVMFLVAYACSLASKNAGPWCEPTSFWQGHAAWHLLCAGSTVFVYLYGRSERYQQVLDG